MDILTFVPVEPHQVVAAELQQVRNVAGNALHGAQIELAEQAFIALRNGALGLERSTLEVAEQAVMVTLQVCHALGGVSLYLPKLNRLYEQRMCRDIRDNFTGHNHNALARKWGITPMRVRQILGSKE